MITREKLNEIEMTIRDLRMAIDFKEQADNGQPFVIVPTANPVSIVFDATKRKEIDDKITELETDLDTKMTELKKARQKAVK